MDLGNIFHKKRRPLARLNGIQKALCNGSNHSLSILEKKFLNEYHQTLHLKEEFWALKSRTDWTLLGNKNTSFFHLSTIYRCRRNKIWCLRDSVGNWTYNPLRSNLRSLLTLPPSTLRKLYILPSLSPTCETFTLSPLTS